MMFFIMARISDPLVPRAIFGVLNTLLFFPSGAVYPIAGFPRWLRVMSDMRPVHLRGARLPHAAAQGRRASPRSTTDIFALTLTSVVVLSGATLLFRRTL